MVSVKEIKLNGKEIVGLFFRFRHSEVVFPCQVLLSGSGEFAEGRDHTVPILPAGIIFSYRNSTIINRATDKNVAFEGLTCIFLQILLILLVKPDFSDSI